MRSRKDWSFYALDTFVARQIVALLPCSPEANKYPSDTCGSTQMQATRQISVPDLATRAATSHFPRLPRFLGHQERQPENPESQTRRMPEKRQPLTSKSFLIQLDTSCKKHTSLQFHPSLHPFITTHITPKNLPIPTPILVQTQPSQKKMNATHPLPIPMPSKYASLISVLLQCRRLDFPKLPTSIHR